MDLSDYLADQRRELHRFFAEPNLTNLERTLMTATTHTVGAVASGAATGCLYRAVADQSNFFFFLAGMSGVIAYVAYAESADSYRKRHVERLKER